VGESVYARYLTFGALLEASGYASRPKDFADLLRILDGEIRLITPTDPEGKEEVLARSASEGSQHPSLVLFEVAPFKRQAEGVKQRQGFPRSDE